MSELIGYLGVSKADGSQTPDPQRDTPAEDQDSGRKTDRPSSAARLPRADLNNKCPPWKRVSAPNVSQCNPLLTRCRPLLTQNAIDF